MWREAIGPISQGGSWWLVETCCTCNILKTCQLTSMQHILVHFLHNHNHRWTPDSNQRIRSRYCSHQPVLTCSTQQEFVRVRRCSYMLEKLGTVRSRGYRLLRETTARGHGIHNSKERGKSNIQATHCGKKAAAFWICNQQKCERARDQAGKYYIILNIYDILKATAETFTESKFDMN